MYRQDTECNDNTRVGWHMLAFIIQEIQRASKQTNYILTVQGIWNSSHWSADLLRVIRHWQVSRQNPCTSLRCKRLCVWCCRYPRSQVISPLNPTVNTHTTQALPVYPLEFSTKNTRNSYHSQRVLLCWMLKWISIMNVKMKFGQWETHHIKFDRFVKLDYDYR